MRWILSDDVETELPPDWQTRVDAARKHVAQMAADARKQVVDAGGTKEQADAAELKALHAAVNSRSSVWAKAGQALREASDGKCWYCEMRQARSDMPVDHFRPKNKVREEPSHPGYWWLAFEWTNLRLSCTYCNSKRRDIETQKSGGKQDCFPIIEPPVRQGCETDPIDRSTLLDPTVEQDPSMLVFQANGFAAPSATDDVSEPFLRAYKSIELYHLNHRALTRKRAQLASDIKKHVTQAQQAKALNNDSGYLFNKTEIVKRVRSKAELATAARAYLRPHGEDIAWVKELLDRDL